ncbi:alpha/beta hydrolase family protein [Altererythrobacter aquiaggeris]|uniref:alpha/beta hydrolase family protein n=1 Tax=Aestuarierythrobacter aquiaggeris TaxID=1898396 RepID=UPI00301A6576
MIASVKGKRLLIVLDENMKAKNSMEVGDIKVRGLDWVGDDAILLTRSDTQELGKRFIGDKAEFSNVMIVPAAAGGEVQTIFSNEKKMLNSVQGNYGKRLIDGRWVGFYGGLEMTRNQGGSYFVGNSAPALYAVDLQTNKLKKVANQSGDYRMSRDWLLDSSGNVAALREWIQTTGEWSIKNADNKVIASGVQDRGRIGLGTLGQDGTTILYSEADEANEMQWFEVPLDGSSSPVRWRPDQDIGSLYTDQFSARLIGYRLDEDRVMPTFFDPAKQTVIDKIAQAFAGRDVYLSEWTPDFSKVLVVTKGNRDSGTWYLVDMATLQASPIGSERPKIKPEQVGPISRFEYSAGDGLELDGILTLPPGREAKNLPLVMLPHGGPAGESTETFDWWAQGIASRGYAVFQPNFRGSTNKDRAFQEAGFGQWGKLMQTDVSDGLKALAAKGIIDPKRACVVGASYGGYVALAGVTLQNGIYRCAVSVNGVADIPKLYSTEKNQRGRNLFARITLIEEFGPEDLHRSISPRHQAERADAPVMIIHGRDDTVVLYEQGKDMYDALRSANKPVEFVELEGEDHWLSTSETRQRMLSELVSFVEKHNPPD